MSSAACIAVGCVVTVETPDKPFGLKGSSAGFITDFETLVRLYVGNLNDVQVQIILSTGVCLLTAACINRHDRPVSFFFFLFFVFWNTVSLLCYPLLARAKFKLVCFSCCDFPVEDKSLIPNRQRTHQVATPSVYTSSQPCALYLDSLLLFLVIKLPLIYRPYPNTTAHPVEFKWVVNS